MTALIWDRNHPNRCACGDTYRPVLTTTGKLIKSREPAWLMKEQTRDPGCLQEQWRKLSAVYGHHYQHHKTSKGASSGYPDCHNWVPLRPDGGGGSAYTELKRMGRNPTDVQCEIMASLQDTIASRRVYLARPCCLLTGAIDALMADLAGTPNLNIKDGPAYTPVHIPDGAPLQRRTTAPPPSTTTVAELAARTRPIYRTPELPGTDPQPFRPAVGIVVPTPTTPAGHAAVLELDNWLRTAGIPPVNVPYPYRLIVGDGRVHAHCRTFVARPDGDDVRVWREGNPTSEFPDHLIDALRADQVCGPSSDRVAYLVGGIRPWADIETAETDNATG